MTCFFIFIEICIILRARLNWPRSSEYEYVGVCVCAASRKTDERNCFVGSVVWKMVKQRKCRDACKCISTKILEIVY